jgi:hypothetical protein
MGIKPIRFGVAMGPSNLGYNPPPPVELRVDKNFTTPA